MFRISVWVYAFFLLACSVLPMAAQQPAAVSANAVVPSIVNFKGVLTDVNGKPLTGTVGVTFYLYQESQGGTPLWMETQNVQPDKVGHYSVALGSTSTQGLPANMFATGEARWLGVQVHGQDEQPRVLLMSVPYALKALDAETIGGKPASAFMMAPTSSSKSQPPVCLRAPSPAAARLTLFPCLPEPRRSGTRKSFRLSGATLASQPRRRPQNWTSAAPATCVTLSPCFPNPLIPHSRCTELRSKSAPPVKLRSSPARPSRHGHSQKRRQRSRTDRRSDHQQRNPEHRHRWRDQCHAGAFLVNCKCKQSVDGRRSGILGWQHESWFGELL